MPKKTPEQLFAYRGAKARWANTTPEQRKAATAKATAARKERAQSRWIESLSAKINQGESES